MAFRKLLVNGGRRGAPSLIGMVHLRALPGTPSYVAGSYKEVVNKAVEEAEIYAKHEGIDALIVENMHDTPYLKSNEIGPETVACMTAICQSIRQSFPSHKPIGVQILAGANQQALAVAKAAGLQFIRAENFVFSHVADEGLMADASAGPLLRFRKSIDAAGEVAVIADIKKKHSAHSLTSDVDIVETLKAAEFFQADGVIITGSSTGCPASTSELERVKEAARIPVAIGSGIQPENARDFASADAFIVGSYFKRNGDWRNELDDHRIRKMCAAVNDIVLP